MSHEWLSEERFRIIERALTFLVTETIFMKKEIRRMNATVDALNTAVSNLSSTLTTGLQDLKDEITNLQGQQAPDLSGAISKINDMIAQVSAADPGPQSSAPGVPSQPGSTTGTGSVLDPVTGLPVTGSPVSTGTTDTTGTGTTST